MRNAKILVPLVLSLTLTACGPVEFLNSCFTREAQTFDPMLAGTWNDTDGTTTVKFLAAGEQDYEMVVTEHQADNSDPEQTRFEARLARLGGFLLLEMVPEAVQVRPGSYPFAQMSSGGEIGFQSRLIEVGDGLYASVVPGEPAPEARNSAGSYEIHLAQAHHVFRVELDGDSLRLTELSDDWLKAQLDAGRIELDHEVVDETVVITATTEEIQRFLSDFSGEQGAFPDDGATELRRQN